MNNCNCIRRQGQEQKWNQHYRFDCFVSRKYSFLFLFLAISIAVGTTTSPSSSALLFCFGWVTPTTVTPNRKYWSIAVQKEQQQKQTQKQQQQQTIDTKYRRKRRTTQVYWSSCSCSSSTTDSSSNRRIRKPEKMAHTRMNMGWVDDFTSNFGGKDSKNHNNNNSSSFKNNNFFLWKRKNDFVKLQNDDKENTLYGPGPLLLLVNVPDTITNDEIYDIISDTCTESTCTHCKLFRIYYYQDSNDSSKTESSTTSCGSIISNPELDLSVQDFLVQIASGQLKQQEQIQEYDLSTNNENTMLNQGYNNTVDIFSNIPTAVLYFSGFGNAEMMNLYNVLGKEIYQEVQSLSMMNTIDTRPTLQDANGDNDVSGAQTPTRTTTTTPPTIPTIPTRPMQQSIQALPACAKAVPNAMIKSMRQVLDEILGDHADACQ